VHELSRKNLPSAVSIDIRSLLRAVTDFSIAYGDDYLSATYLEHTPFATNACCHMYWEDDRLEEDESTENKFHL
jgi:hypothetical protein